MSSKLALDRDSRALPFWCFVARPRVGGKAFETRREPIPGGSDAASLPHTVSKAFPLTRGLPHRQLVEHPSCRKHFGQNSLRCEAPSGGRWVRDRQRQGWRCRAPRMGLPRVSNPPSSGRGRCTKCSTTRFLARCDCLDRRGTVPQPGALGYASPTCPTGKPNSFT